MNLVNNTAGSLLVWSTGIAGRLPLLNKSKSRFNPSTISRSYGVNRAGADYAEMKDERTIHRLPRLNKSKSRFNRAGADYTD